MSKQTNNQLEIEQAAKADDAARTEARRLRARQAIMPTPEEDAVITAAALSDPDNPPLAEGEMAQYTGTPSTRSARER